MSQPSVASYFNNRKRAATNDNTSQKSSKILLLDTHQELAVIGKKIHTEACTATVVVTRKRALAKLFCDEGETGKLEVSSRSGQKIRRIGAASVAKKPAPPVAESKQPPIVKFFKLGDISPKKKVQPSDESSSPVKMAAFASKESSNNIDKGMKTPVKTAPEAAVAPTSRSSKLPQDLSLNEIRSKLTRSSRLTLLATSLNKLQSGMDKLDQMKATRLNAKTTDTLMSRRRKPEEVVPSKNLKEFESIELEVPFSPTKQLSSPLKLYPVTPTKPNDIMTTPKKTTITPRRLLMSPPAKSPTKLPAHLRFQNLAETGRSGATPQLPYKYRNLGEMFKCLDTVCAMFFNRKEKITFKKLKPAVQRMMRKNFHETHLAQIHHLFPEAYNFTIEKTRNYGSATKHDHYQLVIVPNVDEHTNKASGRLIDETDVLKVAQLSPMNPMVMIARLQKFQRILLELVKDEHQAFLQQLDPPMVVERDQIRRWHPEFDLEQCPEVQQGELPQPPQEERFSSAQDVLSTARNLFKCNTAMERALDRLEAKKQKDKEEQKSEESIPEKKPVDDLLKGLPKGLLEKIRAKQAAKALDAMTRRPSQEKESARYNSLPELARHLRNVFVTERKGVLQQDIVLRKVENSFRGKLTLKDLEEHLQLLSKAIPAWLSFHDVRKTIFVKLNRDLDLCKVIDTLEKLAVEKAK